MTTIAAQNLVSHRSTASVWDRRGWKGATVEERLLPWVVSLGGAGLFAIGASRRSWRGAPFMVAGAALVACAAAGLHDPRAILQRLRHQRHAAAEADQVTIEMMDSFPASDSPSTNATTIAATATVEFPSMRDAAAAWD